VFVYPTVHGTQTDCTIHAICHISESAYNLNRCVSPAVLLKENRRVQVIGLEQQQTTMAFDPETKEKPHGCAACDESEQKVLT